MRKNQVVFLLAISLLPACGLRDRLKERKQIEADRNARHSAEESHAFQKVLASRDADLAKKEFEDRRRYYYALEGEFHGQLDPARISADHPEETSPDPISKIHVRLQVEHDFVKLPGSQFTTVEQYKVAGDALSLLVEVNEESGFARSRSRLLLSCSQKGLRPDMKRGTIEFSCQSASAAGREYYLSMDDSETDPKVDRVAENRLARSAYTSDRVLQGDLTRIRSLNAVIRTPFAREFFGRLERRDDGRDVE